MVSPRGGRYRPDSGPLSSSYDGGRVHRIREDDMTPVGGWRMGTKTNPRHRRRSQRRGLASFVSFLLLFAFALGQSSISALASDGGTDPTTSEEAAPPEASRLAGDVPSEEAPVADAPAADAPAEEAPAEEPPADAPADTPSDTPADVPASDATGSDSGTSSGGGANSVSSDGSESGATNNKRSSRNA